MYASKFNFNLTDAYAWLDEPDDELFSLIYDGDPGSNDRMQAWLTEHHPEATVHSICLYAAACYLDNQSDEGAEGCLFDEYMRDVGMFGFHDVDDLFESDMYPRQGQRYDWRSLFHRVLYGLPSVEAYAIKSVATAWGLDYDELQLYLAARSFDLHDKHERELKQV